METVKNLVKDATNTESRFEQGHKVPITHQDVPGSQEQLPYEPADTKVTTAEGGEQRYQAAGKLKGKKAVITGGDSGIGRSIAVLYAMEGADSLIVYLPEEEKDAQRTKQMVEEHGGKCHLVATDIRKWEHCETIIKTAVEKMGAINILVNNAAYQMMQQDISDISYEQWHRTFDTNIHPMYYLSKLALPHMKRGDTIINNASINAYIGRPDLLDYTTTKGAIVSFTRGLANQQMSKGIRVNAVAPGPVWTPLIPATMNKDAQDQFTSPLGRPAQPSEIATCFVFLASPDSGMIAGQTLHPNGGVIVNG